jgi:hypothetical protein
MNLGTVDSSLEVVDGWLLRRESSGEALATAIDGLVLRFLTQWAQATTGAERERVVALLREGGAVGLADSLQSTSSANDANDDSDASQRGAKRDKAASDSLHRLTGARGPEAYEQVEQAFRRSIARMGSRFVATCARAAIDETMGPMHATVVVAELLSLLETIDKPYFESLTYALQTLHDWRAIAERTAAPSEKKKVSRKRTATPLSSPKRRP